MSDNSWLLFEKGDGDVFVDPYGAFVGGIFTREDPEKGRFAAAAWSGGRLVSNR